MPTTRSLATAASLGLGAAGATAITASYRSDMRAAHERLSRGSRVVATAGGPIEVGEPGAAGPLVLVVHGAAGGFDMGLRVGADVLGDGYRVIAPSRFGYLRTPMPTREDRATHAAQADAFAALLDCLDIPEVAVVAVSAGAQSATQLALRHPHRVRAVVLITPALYLPPGPGWRNAGPPDFIFERLFASDLLVWSVVRLAPNLLVRVAGVPQALAPQVTPEFRRNVVDWFFPAAARHIGLGHDIRTTTPVAPDLPIEELRMPVMLVSAADDPHLTADEVRYSAARVPGARVLICESGGHVLLGQAHLVRSRVRGFLADVGIEPAQPPPLATVTAGRRSA